MSQRENLKEIVLKYIDYFHFPLGGGQLPELPKFDYYALDYIIFAEQNFVLINSTKDPKEQENHLICCVANLKRAIDCQIECFFYSWNLDHYFNKKNLGLDTKLQFLKNVGILPLRTIRRFTNIRNKVEHEFQKPNISDLESLFDVVTASVALLQNIIVSRARSSLEVDIYFGRKGFGEPDGYFYINYEINPPSFEFSWNIYRNEKIDGKIITNISDHEEFTYSFKVWYLIHQMDAIARIDFIKEQLNF